MIKERFYEESALSARSEKESKIYTAFLVMAIVFFVFAALLAFISFNDIVGVVSDPETETVFKVLFVVFRVGFILTLALIGFLFFKLKNRFNVSYDYTFVEDELRITKVLNGKKRKFITKILGDQILKIGWCDKPSFEAAVRGLQGKKPTYVTPNKQPCEEKVFIYIVSQTTLERRVYVLECREMLVEYLVLAAGRNKLERE